MRRAPPLTPLQKQDALCAEPLPLQSKGLSYDERIKMNQQSLGGREMMHKKAVKQRVAGWFVLNKIEPTAANIDLFENGARFGIDLVLEQLNDPVRRSIASIEKAESPSIWNRWWGL